LPPSYVSIETGSKVVTSPLASGDLQVTLSHLECLPQTLALNPSDHLSSFASRSTRVALRDLRRVSTVPLTSFSSGASHNLLVCFKRNHHPPKRLGDGNHKE